MKIMFICTGNICRSAMAEAMLKKMLKDRNIENIEVAIFLTATVSFRKWACFYVIKSI